MGGVQIGFGAAGATASVVGASRTGVTGAFGTGVTGLAATSWASIGLLADYILGRIAFVTGASWKKRSELRQILRG